MSRSADSLKEALEHPGEIISLDLDFDKKEDLSELHRVTGLESLKIDNLVFRDLPAGLFELRGLKSLTLRAGYTISGSAITLDPRRREQRRRQRRRNSANPQLSRASRRARAFSTSGSTRGSTWRT